jgi:hypothetical protein
MPTQVGIHVFLCRDQQSRGWRAFARHDDEDDLVSQSFRRLVLAIARCASYGRTMCLAEWARYFGLAEMTLAIGARRAAQSRRYAPLMFAGKSQRLSPTSRSSRSSN